MIRELMHDPLFLSQKSELATKKDVMTATDLVDTLRAHEADCVGMAANMIGVKKKIIAVSAGFGIFVMFNPEITSKRKPYSAEEGCLSLLGGPRKCTRFEEIEVSFFDMSFQKHRQTYSGWVAQIIQHEVDHTNGILI